MEATMAPFFKEKTDLKKDWKNSLENDKLTSKNFDFTIYEEGLDEVHSHLSSLFKK